MSKLTNAEKDKLDNTCGNLRVTKLGTHVKSLEDFVNEGILKTRANDVSNAINELWDMITNKDCESITIPPPGFFTLFGDDQTGKLYVYYNNADYPPQFRHVETPGELEGTLYLYIADPVGENHYELEVGHYIAVKHLDNYYTKEQVRSMFTVTVEKQTTAESGSFATYVVKQGGSQVGSKINIPKDYLVKSCSVKTCTTANVPVQGYTVGDKYIDWVINTRDGSASNEHLYLLVNEIVDPYKPDNSTIALSSGNVFSVKDGGITLVKLAPALQNLINGKADANHAHGNITKEGKVGTTANVPLITGSEGVVQAGSFGSGANNFARGNHGHSDLASIAYVDNQIASVEGDVVIDLASKADVDHNHDSTYIKKTGGVSQHSNGNIIIPSASNTTDIDATGKIPFAGHLVSTTYSIEEFTAKLKSLMGGLKDKDNRWWNVISARQTNGGGSEAEINGLILKSILDINSDLLWNKQRNGTWGTAKTILDSSNYSNYANKTTVSDSLTDSSTTNALSANQGKVLNDRYKGITLASGGTITTKPYYRLFHIESGSGSSRSSRLIFEISSKTSTAYAKFAVYMRQNTSTSASTIDFQCLEKVGFDLNSISVGFRNNYPNTSCDIYINVQSMVHYIIKVIDDQLREGTYIQYSPTEGNIEAYTSVANAGTQLYGSAYTNIINPQWNIVATTIKKAGGTSSQFLKADGSVGTVVNDSTTGGTGDVLSAEQGKVLKGLVDGKSPSTHNHDGTYVKTSDVYDGLDSTSTSKTLSANQGKVLKGLVDGKAPTSHAVNASTYGLGTTGVYGHVKLSDAYTNSGGQASQSVGASSKAVYDAYTNVNNKVTAITSLNQSVQTITSFQNSYSGTLKWMVKNGWMFMTFENLKCTSTNSGFVAISSFSYGPETNDMVYWNYYPGNPSNAVSVRVTSGGSIQARCFTANSVVNGHMSFPCKLL